MFAIRSVVTFFLSTIAFMFLLLANLSGADAPFVRNLYFSKIEDKYSQYIWTMYNFCSFSGKELTGDGTCSHSKPAYPYEPFQWSSGFSRFSVYRSGSKAAYALILLALIGTIVANLAGLVAFFQRSAKLYNIYRLTTIVSLLLIFIGAVINTGLHRNGVKRIINDGVYSAAMGKTMIAFIWLPVIFQLVAVLIAYFWKVDNKPQQADPEAEKYEMNNPFANPVRQAL